ncbi:DEAD/DEAH box helicase [Salisediminibacterium beveridgei]|nr:DEAD/DEAH box helicase [Salisediminibacterium beveridgei]
MLNELVSSMRTCKSFYFSVAFINFSGLQLLLEPLQEAKERGIKGRIITSTYLNFTEPKALHKIKEFDHLDLKIFVTDKEIGFHTKVYIFEYDDYYKVIIGSSNLTQSALKSNIEWNVEIISKPNGDFIENVRHEFDRLWQDSREASENLLKEYADFIRDLPKKEDTPTLIFEREDYITPNRMQKRARENLERIRSYGEDRALVIAATGTGKTYMSAFDVKEFEPKRLLFLVHRGEIMRKAMETFQHLIPNNKDKQCGLFTGTEKNIEADYLFATIQTVKGHYHRFRPDEFDYIIVDEAHHAAAQTYREVMNYFKPKFMLGMTATPERSDSQSVFELFDHNVAVEVRLHEALDDELIIPFHYFGITDIDAVDLSDVDIDDIEEVTKRLKVHERVDYIIEQMLFYGHDGELRKCLGFCASIEHAKYMTDEFNHRGILSTHLSGSDSAEVREQTMNRLEDDKDPLEVIFTVDIFNEGVDLPSVNQVLMLRPTNSPIIFIQQLGRGLRRHEGKSFLTVLDFIGNHKRTFLIAIALNGSRFYDKESLKVAVSTDFANIPGSTHIQMDEISKERILSQIDQENFNSMKYLREAYLEFKQFLNGKTPHYLVDYLTYDGAPDPVAFISKKNHYLDFVATVEKDDQLKGLCIDEEFDKALKDLSKRLPIKRIHDFVVIRMLFEQDIVTLNEATKEIEKYIQTVYRDTVIHVFEAINHDFFDHVKKKHAFKMAEFDGVSTLTRTASLARLLQHEAYRKYLEDALFYGILRYEREFQTIDYGIPHFKLYEQYQMVDAAILSNYRKTHSAFRGSGLLKNGKDFFLFIDLHKEADIDERINYKDQFIDRRYFQWQSQNATKQISDTGQDIIYNEKRGVHLHLFVRKYRKIDAKTEPYIYIGKGHTVEYSGEQPITTILRLEHEVPQNLYVEFTEKV